MDNFNEAFTQFMWERLDPAMVKDEEHKALLDKINCNGQDERLAIVDYGNAIAEVDYKAGLKDGMRLASELGVCANE